MLTYCPQYGIQINGWLQHPVLGLSLWLQRRSPSKPTWPGLMDNFVGGGLAAGLSVKENAIKEAKVKSKLVQC